jgi:hypothetical protein
MTPQHASASARQMVSFTKAGLCFPLALTRPYLRSSRNRRGCSAACFAGMPPRCTGIAAHRLLRASRVRVCSQVDTERILWRANYEARSRCVHCSAFASAQHRSVRRSSTGDFVTRCALCLFGKRWTRTPETSSPPCCSCLVRMRRACRRTDPRRWQKLLSRRSWQKPRQKAYGMCILRASQVRILLARLLGLVAVSPLRVCADVLRRLAADTSEVRVVALLACVGAPDTCASVAACDLCWRGPRRRVVLREHEAHR